MVRSRVLEKICGSSSKICGLWSSVVMVSNEDLSLICKNLLGLSCEATDRVLDVCLYILQSSNQLYKVSFLFEFLVLGIDNYRINFWF